MARTDDTRLHKAVGATPPNLADLAATRRSFSWQQACEELGTSPGGGLNIADVAVHRHGRGARADHVALRCLDRRGGRREIRYRELAALSNRFQAYADGLRFSDAVHGHAHQVHPRRGKRRRIGAGREVGGRYGHRLHGSSPVTTHRPGRQPGD
jgi:hypothetical protein